MIYDLNIHSQWKALPALACLSFKNREKAGFCATYTPNG